MNLTADERVELIQTIEKDRGFVYNSKVARKTFVIGDPVIICTCFEETRNNALRIWVSTPQNCPTTNAALVMFRGTCVANAFRYEILRECPQNAFKSVIMRSAACRASQITDSTHLPIPAHRFCLPLRQSSGLADGFQD